MLAYLFDVIIVLILAFFAWRGAKKGLILTLCSLLGIFVAFFGARFVSAQFYEPVANIIEPAIYQSLLGEDNGNTQKASFSPDPAEPAEDPYSLDELLDIIRESKLFSGFTQLLEEAVDSHAVQETEKETPARALSGYLARLIAKAGLFALTFLVILLVWFLVGRLLDLAFHLPVLSAFNWIGGLVLGLVKAALLVVVLVWMGQLAGLVPNPPKTPVLSLFTVQRIMGFLNSLVA